MAVGTLWYAQQAEAWINLGGIASVPFTASFTQTLLELMGTSSTTIQTGYRKEWTGRVTNVSVRGGNRGYKAVDTLGIVQLGQQGRPELVTAEFGVIFENADAAIYITGSGVTGCTSYTRFQYGEKSTAAADRQKIAMLFKTTDGTKVYHFLMNNAYLIGRDMTLNSDGYVEEKWTIGALAQDCYEEDNF